MFKILLTLLLMLPTLSWGLSRGGYEALRALPVQDGGRIKPLDTFAMESMQLIYGKSKFEGRNPVEIFMTWVLAPEEWRTKRIFLVRHSGLREGLKLENDRQLYTLEELLANDRLGLSINSLRGRLAKKEKLDSYFQAVQKLGNQIQRFHMIANGSDVRVAPLGGEETRWQSVKDLTGDKKDLFNLVVSKFAAELSLQSADKGVGLKEAVGDYIAGVQKEFGNGYASFNQIKTEVHYNKLKPFMWSFIFYLLASFLILLQFAFNKPFFNILIWLSVIIGFILHTYGIGLRVFISDRPPVSNMFETVVWVPWIAVLSAFFIEIKNKSKVVLLGASLVGVICLILVHLAPTILDGSFSPLEPVLKDNFWLLTHVIIIVSSYGPYFLAFLLGDVALVYYLIDEKKHKAKLKEMANVMYRCIQIGSVLLLAGTILGGVWADYSWGRFWGWDPKETWAFIAFMGYIAILHAKLVGWVKDFGMAIGSVAAFSLVIMAWYGVNYVLGAGLHSYGFGAGGLEYVATFVGVHFLFIGYVFLMRKSKA